MSVACRHCLCPVLSQNLPKPQRVNSEPIYPKAPKALVSTDMFEYCKYNARYLLSDIMPVITVAENKVHRVTLLLFCRGMLYSFKDIWMIEVNCLGHTGLKSTRE